MFLDQRSEYFSLALSSHYWNWYYFASNGLLMLP